MLIALQHIYILLQKIYVEMYASVRPEWLRACFKVDEQKDKEFVW